MRVIAEMCRLQWGTTRSVCIFVHPRWRSPCLSVRGRKLSEERAFAVKQWLESQSASNFPEGRVKVFAHGMTQPVAPNTTAEGRAKNRRVEIVLGTSG